MLLAEDARRCYLKEDKDASVKRGHYVKERACLYKECHTTTLIRSSFRRLASKGFPSGCSKSVRVRLQSENSEPTMLFSQTMPEEHPPTPPPCRRPTLLALPTLAKFQLVCRQLCDGVLFHSSCVIKHTNMAVSALPEYQSCREYDDHSSIL